MKLKTMVLPLLLGLSQSAFATPTPAPSPEAALKAEAAARSDALVKQGYNLTHGFRLPALPQAATERFELLVPEDEPHTFSLWAASLDGTVNARLLGPDGSPRAAFRGASGEATVAYTASAGKYELELERPAGTSVQALLGVKGPAIHRCAPVAGVQEELAFAAKGFHWPYLLFVPAKVTSTHLLVRPNNTGFSTEELELLRASASCELQSATALAQALGAPLLIPLFPRPQVAGPTDDLYLHALTRASLQTPVPAYSRVDLQLLAMIDDARAALAKKGIALEPTVLAWGFSASGSFVDRFAMLHPERVLAVAVGSPGGWPLAPVRSAAGELLPWPVGVSDVQALTGAPVDFTRLKQVAWYFYLGDHDENDAVVHRDSFSSEDEALIARRFGNKPVARWAAAEKLARGAGLKASFKLYPGASHSVTPEMAADVETFFHRALDQAH
jgi:hypothetical protein